MIFGDPQEAGVPACLMHMVLRGATPQRGGAITNAALRGGTEMPRLLCCRISQTHYSGSARSSASHSGHFSPIAIPAITWTGSWKLRPFVTSFFPAFYDPWCPEIKVNSNCLLGVSKPRHDRNIRFTQPTRNSYLCIRLRQRRTARLAAVPVPTVTGHPL